MLKVRKGIIVMCAVALTVGLTSVSAQAATVLMHVNQAQDKLVVTSPGNCTRGANHVGCVRGQGQQLINFNLVGDRRCSTGGRWELQSVALGMNDGSVGNLQPPVVPGDFNANPGTGIVTLTERDHDDHRSHIQIRNNNTAVYDVWYTVYATCATAPGPINTDPRIENDGTGRP